MNASWQDAFPLTEAQRAVQFLVDEWIWITKLKPKAFRPTLRENQLTEKFSICLAKRSLGVGRLFGFWAYEEQGGDIEESHDDLTVVRRIRKDITYKYNASNARLQLTFEFKKLSATKASCRAYIGRQGMRRFIDGNYDKDRPLALMVAMIMGDFMESREMLRQVLLHENNRKDLQLLTDQYGNYVVDPSMVFPDVAAFDTRHQRQATFGSAESILVLSHRGCK